MARVLTVDDSRAIRSIVTKNMVELGFEVDEAENGEIGLNKLFAGQFDLVVLDVTMPVLDGPGMLEQMRARSNKTPVLMLTSESSSSVIASVLKQGISDYILKPFQGDDLKKKVKKILKISDGDIQQGARPTGDVLIIDDIENVSKRLRTLLPEKLGMDFSPSSKAALAQCREKQYKVILVDVDLPETDTASFLKQLRLLQPTTAIFTMPVRSEKNAEADAKAAGFDGVVFKPFDAEGIDTIGARFAESQEVLSHKDNIVTMSKFIGKEDKIEHYFNQMMPLFDKAIKEAAAACFDLIVLDMSAVPVRAARLPKLVMEFSERASRVGLNLKIVGTHEVKQALNAFTDTGSIPFFDSVSNATA
jgi:DNA-binding response OmpR family regulator